jgi:hypothetical protein
MNRDSGADAQPRGYSNGFAYGAAPADAGEPIEIKPADFDAFDARSRTCRRPTAKRMSPSSATS